MKKFLKRRFAFAAVALLMCITVFAGCSTNDTTEIEEEEEAEVQTLTVADEEYYKRFYDDDISINVYNWGEYISDGSDDGTLNVNAEFTNLTGIKVNYTNYATNEELYAKLKGGGASYDIIIPSDYMISRMIKEEMVLPLDMDNIPNYKYIGEAYKNQAFDPENEYSVPYFWGTVGIIYDTTLIEEENIDWDILWNEDYADRILMFDNPRDAFAIAELRLGYSLNTEDEKELEEAAELLKEQKKVVQAYVMDEIFDKMGAGEALIAPYYAGDAVTLMAEYEDLGFVIPESGTNLFIDGICIPKGAKQKEAAEMYINFLCEPDIAYSNTYYVGYSTPISEAKQYLDPEVVADPLHYPSDEILANTEVFVNLPDEIADLLDTLWAEVKMGGPGDAATLIAIILAFLALYIGIIIYKKIKRRRELL